MAHDMKLLRYVHGYADRHGKRRYDFRRKGFKGVPLHGEPWSREFMAQLEAALAGERLSVGTGRASAGSTANAILLFRLRQTDQRVRRLQDHQKPGDEARSPSHPRAVQREARPPSFGLLDRTGIERGVATMETTPGAAGSSATCSGASAGGRSPRSR